MSMNWNRSKPVRQVESRADRRHESLVNKFLNSATRQSNKPRPRAVPQHKPQANLAAAIQASLKNPDPPWDVDPGYKPISRWPR